MMQFNLAQIDRLSEMLANFSLVILASLVLPSLSQQQNLHPLIVWWGIMAALGSAYLSLTILEGVDK